MIPKLVIFDLDGTLARSKQAIETEMGILLEKLLSKVKVAVISGGALEQLQKQVAGNIPREANLENLFLLPTSGAGLFKFIEGKWGSIYQETLTEDEFRKIEEVIVLGVEESGVVDLSESSYGERTERRGAQVTFSALGQEAPISEKEAWDKDGEKKKVLRELIAKRLPDFDVKTGGSTSIDITKLGINKAFGLRNLSKYLGIKIEEMLYVGDALNSGGNDEVVKETGINTRSVGDPDETMRVIEALIGE